MRVHINNIPTDVTVERLAALCRGLGFDGEVHLARDGGSGCFLGEAYLDTRGEAEASRAAALLDGHPLDGCPLSAEAVETSGFFDRDGLNADGSATMGRRDGSHAGD